MFYERVVYTKTFSHTEITDRTSDVILRKAFKYVGVLLTKEENIMKRKCSLNGIFFNKRAMNINQIFDDLERGDNFRVTFFFKFCPVEFACHGSVMC